MSNHGNGSFTGQNDCTLSKQTRSDPDLLVVGNRDEDGNAIFRPNGSGDVTLAGEVFGQFDAARADLNRLPSGQYELCVAAQRDHILAACRRVIAVLAPGGRAANL